MIKIAIDSMGSDEGPEVLSEGVLDYLKDNKDVSFRIFGDEQILNGIYAGVDRVEVVGTTEVVPMECKPLDFLRHRDSSMYKAIQAVKAKDCDAVVTAGSTGGFVAGCTILLRNIPGVPRAGLCAPFPTYKKGKAALIIDIGANNVNTGNDLYCFAKMAYIYSQYILKNDNPSTYVISNGTEEGKGTEEIVEAYNLLKENNFPGFKGNAEARNVLDGEHDIIVCPGFVGNVLLKSTEGVASLMNQMIKDAFKKNPLTMLGYLFANGGFKDMKKTMDYRKYGGAMLLGINGCAVKAHGNSNAYAFYNALDVSYNMAKVDLVGLIRRDLNEE